MVFWDGRASNVSRYLPVRVSSIDLLYARTLEEYQQEETLRIDGGMDAYLDPQSP